MIIVTHRIVRKKADTTKKAVLYSFQQFAMIRVPDRRCEFNLRSNNCAIQQFRSFDIAKVFAITHYKTQFPIRTTCNVPYMLIEPQVAGERDSQIPNAR